MMCLDSRPPLGELGLHGECWFEDCNLVGFGDGDVTGVERTIEGKKASNMAVRVVDVVEPQK